MKRSIKLLFTGVLAALLMTMVGCSTLEERQERQRVTHQLVEQAISQRRMTIEVDHMQTQRYGNHRVTSDFCLKLRGDTLESYLPFFGQVYRAEFGEQTGLNFSDKIVQYQAGKVKNDRYAVELVVRRNLEMLVYRFDIFDNGRATVTVHSDNRDTMVFSGEMIVGE